MKSSQGRSGARHDRVNPANSLDLDRDDAGRITTRTETLAGTTHVLTYTYDPDRDWPTEVRRGGNLVESHS